MCRITVAIVCLYVAFGFQSDMRAQHLLCVVHRRAMRIYASRIGIIGPVLTAFGSVLWSTNTGAEPSSPYDLKLVQVLFRHGARTPLKSIPDVMEVKPLLLHLIAPCVYSS